MNQTVETLLDQAMSLSESDRAELAAALLESLDPPSDESVDIAWREEVARRVAALDAGELDTVSWHEVRDALWTQFGVRDKR